MPRPRSGPSATSARRARLRLLATLGLIAGALILAACGGSSLAGSSSSAKSADSAADNALKFSKCMREHGVSNFPNPEIGPNGETRLRFSGGGAKLSPQTLEAAQKACQHFRAAQAPRNISPQEKVAAEEALLKFARCMREHGIHVETQAVGPGGGIGIRIHSKKGEGGANPESPAFQAAQKDCQGLLPNKRAKGSGPTTSSTSGSESAKSGGGPSLQSGG